MRDRNSGFRSLGVWLVAGLFLGLAFTAGAASGADNAAFVSYSGVPSAMHPGDTATVTVTMRNTGTTTWKAKVETETDDSVQTTTRTIFSLDAVGHGWGVNGVAVSGSVAPNATRSFQFTITAPETATKRNYVFRWQMARDTVVTERPIHARSPGTFGAATPSWTIQVGPDTAPSFGNATIPDQSWVKASRITPVTLPGATGGNGTLSYALMCSLPPGVSFASATKRISGAPRRLWPETTCTWKVTDADDNTAASDADTLTFMIEVVPPDTTPELPSVADQRWLEGTAIAPVVLPEATGGNAPLTYSLSPSPPRGVTFNASTRTLSGTPTRPQIARTYTYKVTDLDGDTDTETFTIEVVPDTEPELPPVVDRVWLEGTAIAPAVLPEATGGNAPLTYSLSPSPPRGVTFNASTRTLSGTPTRPQIARTYTYKVTDLDGDTDTETFTIEVVPDTEPELPPVVDRVWLEGTAIAPAVLPEATGGNAPLTYSLSPSPPRGVTFNASTRTLSGTPTRPQIARTYTYKVTDLDGDTDTETFTIEVVPDTTPELPPVVDRVWLEGTAIAPAVLPEATGGNAPLTYSLSPSPPRGVTFNASTRTLSGTPTRPQIARTYTYKVTDLDGDTDTETFTIEVVPDTTPELPPVVDRVWLEGTAIAPAVLPEATGGNAPLTYSLSPSPPRGVTFNASTRTLSGTPTRAQSARTYTYKVTDLDGDTDTETFTIEVVPDTEPEFSDTVDDQVWLAGTATTPVELPGATGGNAPLTYSLSPSPPSGVRFNASTRTLSGTPTRAQSARTYTYKVTDADGDTDTETFTIEVVPDTEPEFSDTVDDQVWLAGTAITPVELPGATGGNAPLTYSLSPSPPSGVRFNASTRTLSGTPTRAQSARTYTYKVRDADGDTDTETFTIEVVPDTEPEFSDTVDDQVWLAGTAITPVELPGATGGNAPLTYSLSPSPPSGVTFNASTRTLSGTPTRAQSARTYTYKVTDADGDMDTETFTIEVVPDTPPVFDWTVGNQVWVEGTPVAFTLPSATGGNAPLSYALSCSLPRGIARNSFRISGTPRTVGGPTTCTWSVTDSDGNTSASDADTETFTIEVVPDTPPVFSRPVDDLEWVQGTAIAPVTLPGATEGNGDLIYALSPSPPAGVTFDASARTLSGAPTATQSATTYTYTVTDSDGNTAASDADAQQFTITIVEADTAPVFSETAGDLEWVKDTAIAPMTLAVATGGNGELTYALSPSPPAGVTFSPSARTLSGTPTTTQDATEYTYTVTDSDGNTAASDADAQRFTITIVEADTAPVFSETAGDLEWVKDTAIAPMTLPVATGGNGELIYALSPSPPAGVTFSPSTRTLSGTPTTTQTVTEYTYTVTDSDGNTAASDADAQQFTIAIVEADTAPVFSRTAGDQEWVKGTAIAPVTLPGATEGNGDLIYALSPSPPAGVTFDASARTLSGTPTATQDATEYTYTVTDSDGNTSASDADAQQFTIAIVEADTAPVFSETAGDLEWVKDTAIAPMTLPVATGGNGELIYALSPSPPAGVTFSPSARTLSGTPTTTQDATEYTYTVTDSDGNTAASDADTLTFTIAVVVAEADTTPSFGNETADDLILTRNQAMAAATLPEATGGNGDLTYSLTGDLPAGVTFDASTRTLSGTPTERQSALEYTYTATDGDGDAASLSFTIEVAGMGSDDASFVSYTNVPSTMTAGSMATVTVRMQNTGTTTWTSADGYALGSRRPLDNVTWGLNRVPLPADVVPNATVDFTFEITAPATVQGHKFSWRMIRGASGWFGRKTDLLEITVEAAASPSFGASTILGQTWVKDVAIDALTLPAATGGAGELAYTLAGDLPAGVTFDAATRTLSGTPTKKQEATEYTYTATDADGDAASLSFTIQVAGRASDDASFVSYAGVPSTMAAGSSATVTVRMRNTGTTTWTSADGYQLGSQRPQDNVTWGLSRVSLASEVAPNATVDFTFAITAPATIQGHNFRWRMLRGAGGWFGDKTELREITVEADESPSFGASTIPGQTWVKNTAIASSTLPAATGGNGELVYALGGDLPAGVTFDASTRILSGTPAKKQEATEYTYTATDADGDAASLLFTIEVAGRASDDASFVSYVDVPSKMAAGSSATVTVRMLNTGTTTWTSADGYQLGSQRPQDNVTWGLSRVALPSDVAPNATVDFTFAITAPATVKGHKFRWRMLQGTAGWFGDKTEIHEIAVEDPSFGDATIPDQTWARSVPIEALALPEASGSGGVLTYALTPSLPDGLAFTASTRTVSGTPTTVQAATEYTYTATDIDGDDATLAFTIAIEAAEIDDASFVSVSGAPTKMAAGGTATVTVTMQNTGTTTWTSSGGYGLGSQSPQDNDTWGLSRVPVPSDVVPNESVAFTFTITAPETAGSYTFAWSMVRDPGAWFGSGTGDVTIVVEDPSFGDATVADQTWAQDTVIDALTLPAASGSGGVLTYALTPSLPDGVTFDASTRTLSGTPTTVQGATEYTYTATDADGDAATLSFEVTVAAAPRDDAVFVSYTGVPSKMAAGGTATVTVTMRNTGTTTWTSSAGYRLGSQRPQDNETWGSSRVSLPSDVAPDATAAFTFTITAPETTGSHRFRWQMIRDTDGWFGGKTEVRTIEVEDPSFGDAAIAAQTWVQNTAIEALTLPAASGGDGGLTYALTPSLPDGVTFNASTRTLSGMPTAVQEAVEYTYTATDADSDAATLSFEITVAPSSSSSSAAARALPPPAPTGVFDMFEYWLLPRGSALKVRARLRDGRIAPVEGSSYLRSFWRGELGGGRSLFWGARAASATTSSRKSRTASTTGARSKAPRQAAKPARARRLTAPSAG